MILRALRGLYQWRSIFHLHGKQFNIEGTLLNIVLKVCKPGFLSCFPVMKLRIKSARENCVLLLAVWRMGVEMWFTDMAVRLLAPAVEEEERPCIRCVFSHSSLQHSTVWCCVLSCSRVKRVRTWAVCFSAHNGKKAIPLSKAYFFSCLLPLVLSLLLIRPSQLN